MLLKALAEAKNIRKAAEHRYFGDVVHSCAQQENGVLEALADKVLVRLDAEDIFEQAK